MSEHFTIETVPTPAMVIDMPTVRRNIEKMAGYCRQHRLKLRPHTKTHKSVYMARQQVLAGVTGLTVAKLGEAEVMAEAGDDILIAYPALDPNRASKLAELAKRKTIRVGVDSKLAIDRLGQAAQDGGSEIGILVDLDVGFHRTGAQTPEQATELATHADRTDGVRLDGIMCFPGHVREPGSEQGPVLAAVAAFIDATIDQWKGHGLSARIVSGGSSPSAHQSHQIKSLTEIRPGTYIYHDHNQLAGGRCTIDECAARMVFTVISDAVPGKVVLDGGAKSLTMDRLFRDSDTAGFGRLVDYPDARIVRLSEEHAEVDLSRCVQRPKLGERLQLIPNHICPVINLHDYVWLKDGDETLTRLPVDARGKTV